MMNQGIMGIARYQGGGDVTGGNQQAEEQVLDFVDWFNSLPNPHHVKREYRDLPDYKKPDNINDSEFLRDEYNHYLTLRGLNEIATDADNFLEASRLRIAGDTSYNPLFSRTDTGGDVSREEALNQLYNDLFFRDVGDVGREYWLSGEGANVPTDQLRQALTAGAIGDDARIQQVRDIYNDELLRDPAQTGDLSGLEYWTGLDVDKENDPGTTSLTDFNAIREAVRQSSEGIALDEYETYLRTLADQVNTGTITLDEAYDQAAVDYKRLSESGQVFDISLGRAINNVFGEGAEEVAARLDTAIGGSGTETGGTGTETGGTGTETGGGLASLQSQLDALQGNYDSLLSQYEELRALLDSGTGGTPTYSPPFGGTDYTGVSITPYSSTPGGYSGPGGVMRPTIQQTPYTQIPQLQGGPSLSGSASYLRPFGTTGTPEDSFLSDPFSPASNVGYMPPPVYFPFAYQSG